MTRFDREMVGRIVELADERIRAVVLPDQGADIASLVDRHTGHELLFQAPWGRCDRRRLPQYPDSLSAWMAAYGGGWQVLCPNGGAETDGPGVRWGYHGEACLLPWRVLEAADDAVELDVVLRTAPVRLRRRIGVLDGVLRLDQRLTNESETDLDLMWIEHPAFGRPLIGPEARLETAATRVSTDTEMAGDTLAAGRRWSWPVAADREGGSVDLRRIPGALAPRALLAYLEDFERHEAAIVNPELGVTVTLRWSGEVWPYAWLWQETGGTRGYPWFGRAHVVAIEPASTIPAWGMRRAVEHGGHPLHVEAGASVDAWVELAVESAAVTV